MNTGIVKVRNMVIGEGVPKICISIIEHTKDRILETANELEETCVDFVEWRADFFEGIEDREAVKNVIIELKQCLSQKPLLFTFRTKKEGGDREFSQDQYFELLTLIIEFGCIDMIDMEVMSDEVKVLPFIKQAQEAGIKVIGSYHDFEKTPSEEDIILKLGKMQQMGVDIPKLAVMPNTEEDVLTLLSATLKMKKQHANRPIITMSMGRAGLVSRLAGEIFGSAVTFGCRGQASAPGQVEVTALKEMLYCMHTPTFPFHIVLIGFMGVGKSTVSRILSEALGLPEIDTDSYIVEHEKRSIADIFARDGEEHFRNIESNAIRELIKKEPSILSCGGGAVLRSENIDWLKEKGKIVLLTATPETTWERVRYSEERPILNGNMTVDFIKELMEKRREIYQKAADVVIETDSKSPNQVAEEIVNILKRRDKNDQ